MMPPMPWSQIARELPRAFYRAVHLVVTFDDTDPTQMPSQSDEAFRDEVARFTHGEVAPSPGIRQPRTGDVTGVAGWVYLPDHRTFSVQLYAGGDPLPVPLHRAEGADVAAHFHDPSARNLRFDLVGTCSMPCSLLVLAGDQATFVLLSAAATGAHHLAGSDGTLFLDRVSVLEGTQPTDGLPSWPRRLKLRILGAIFAVYHSAGPAFILAGFAAYLAMMGWTIRGARSRLFVVETALLGGAATLAAALALMDVTAYPVINSHYLEPCFAFILLFAAIAVSDFGRQLAASMIRRRVALATRDTA